MTVILYPRVSEEDQIPRETGRDHEENTAKLLDADRIRTELDFLGRTINRIRSGRAEVDYGGFPRGLVHDTLTFILQHLRQTLALLSPIIQDIKTAPHAKIFLAQLLDELAQESIEAIGKIGQTNKLISIAKWVAGVFAKTHSRVVGLADSHTVVFPVYSAAKSVNQGVKVASFVFDRHIDLAGPHTLKSFIYASALDRDIIDFLVFAGLPGSGDRTDDECFRKYQQQGKVGFIPDEEYEENDQVDETRFAIAVKRQFPVLKEMGITAITITIDLDVLSSDQGYTAFDFSPAHLFTVLLRMDVQKMTPQEIVDTFVFGKSKKVGELFSQCYVMAGKGLTLTALEQAIDAIKAACALSGISFGIPLSCGGLYLGEIVELIGPDYQGRTTGAVGSLIKRYFK